MEYTIRDADATQLDRLEEIEQACFSMPWTRQQLQTQLTDSTHVLIAAEVGGTVAGYVGMMYIIDEGYISNVAVAPEYRRQGLADALIAELCRRCAKLELVFVTLEVRRSNAAAIALYEKHGFSVVGERKNYYERPREDALLMTKFFSEAK